MNLKAALDELIAHANLELDSASRDSLLRYAELVREWNARLDLTAAREAETLMEVLFADSMAMTRHELIPEGTRWVDIGSGAGAPALGCAIARPDLELTMIEPLRKRVAFLRTAIGSLDLTNRVRVVESRVDPRRPAELAGAPELATARATFAPDEWLRVGLWLAPTCLVFVASELPETPPDASLASAFSYTLPFSGAPRRIGRYQRSRSAAT